MVELEYLTGDAVRPAIRPSEPCVALCQVVNDAARYGMGFSGAIAARFPEIRTMYRQAGKNLVLGENQYVSVMRDTKQYFLVNMIAQEGIATAQERQRGVVTFRPEALRSCLMKLTDELLRKKYLPRVIMPKIGSGLGGADWVTDVEPIIKDTLCRANIFVTIYSLPE